MTDSLEHDAPYNRSAAIIMGLSGNNKRYEQIGNLIYMMGQPPERREAIVAEIMWQLQTFLDGKPCRVYGSNLGLDLKEVYLLPDVVVLCDADKTRFGPRGYRGVPRMLVEVTSSATNYLDFDEKMRIYESVGVGEYRVISDTQNVATYVLHDGKFIPAVHQTEKTILEVGASVFPNLVVKLDKDKVELS